MNEATSQDTDKNARPLRIPFALNATIKLGTPSKVEARLSMEEVFKELPPDARSVRPKRLNFNVWSPGVLLIRRLEVGGVNLYPGQTVDAWQFNANAVGSHIDVVMLSRHHEVVLEGDYTGMYVPPIENSGKDYLISLGCTSEILYASEEPARLQRWRSQLLLGLVQWREEAEAWNSANPNETVDIALDDIAKEIEAIRAVMRGPASPPGTP